MVQGILPKSSSVSGGRLGIASGWTGGDTAVTVDPNGRRFDISYVLTPVNTAAAPAPNDVVIGPTSLRSTTAFVNGVPNPAFFHIGFPQAASGYLKTLHFGATTAGTGAVMTATVGKYDPTVGTFVVSTSPRRSATATATWNAGQSLVAVDFSASNMLIKKASHSCRHQLQDTAHHVAWNS
jgi:hypothetical protein